MRPRRKTSVPNLFEFAGFAGGVAGAIGGGVLGHDLLGWIGGGGGVPIGYVGGFVAGVGLVGLGFFIGITKERFEQHHWLRKHFGRYWAREREADWEKLKGTLSPGQSLSGKVVAQFYFGVFIDTGDRFPALLTIGRSRTGIGAPQAAVGECVTASVFRLDDDWGRYIDLTQDEDSPSPSAPG